MIKGEFAIIRAVDMHMHVGFAEDPATFARDLKDAGIAAFSNTVCLPEYMRLQKAIGDTDMLRIGAGMHPWWVDAGSSEKLLEAIGDTRFIGEVGLDFWPTHLPTRDEQLAAFERIASACASAGERLISMHSVKAERELIDILDASGCLKSCICILHSYGGSSDQLTRAIDAGCYFSVGPRMLSTKRGCEYARVIPQDRLLIETDLPEREGAIGDAEYVAQTIDDVIEQLAQIRNCGQDGLSASICKRSRYLLDI